MRKRNGIIIFTYIGLIAIGVAAIYRIFHLSVTMGDYYRGVIPEDSTITVENRTFRFEKGEEVGKRGNILSEDNTILLSTIFVYDLYWKPYNVVFSKNDKLYMDNVDSLIQIFYRINPQKSVAQYTKLIKDDYLKYREIYVSAKLKMESKDKKTRTKGREELQKLAHRLQEKSATVLIQISNTEHAAKWVRQRDINEIDSLFKGWKDNTFRGGCQRDRKEERRQLMGGYPSSILGTLKKDKGEKTYSYRGIEGFYDSILSGEAVGKRILKVNDITVRLKENKRIAPINGHNIITTINNDIQRVTREALRKRLLEDPTATWGCAMVMDVKTGQIKAIVNLDKRGDFCEELSDHATTESFEPGSTFKLMTLMAAFESEKADTGTLVQCEKGVFTLKRAFATSDNIGMFQAAKMGYSDIHSFGKALIKMGLGNDLKIETANAKTPRLTSITRKEIDYDRMTHGYSIQVPPIYMLAYYNAVANNGVYVRPTLIKAIVSPNGERTDIKTDTVQKQICSPKTIALAQHCLEAVVTEGTAKRAQDNRYKAAKANNDPNARPLIAGKTGTAFIFDKGEYLQGVKNSSFIGYFPAENPKYSCLVFISKTTLDAGYIAAPVCREIAEKLNAHYDEMSTGKQKEIKKENMPVNALGYWKDMAMIYKELSIPVKSAADGNKYVEAVRTADSAIVFKEKNITNLLQASLLKATAKDAVDILEKQGYKVQIQGIGKVSEVRIEGKKAIIVLN